MILIKMEDRILALEGSAFFYIIEGGASSRCPFLIEVSFQIGTASPEGLSIAGAKTRQEAERGIQDIYEALRNGEPIELKKGCTP